MKPQLSDLGTERGAPETTKYGGYHEERGIREKGHHRAVFELLGSLLRCSCMALTLKSVHEILSIGLQVRPPTSSQTGHWTVHAGTALDASAKVLKPKLSF